MFTLGPLLESTRQTWEIGLPRIIEHVENLTIDISPNFRNRHFGSSYGQEKTAQELIEEFEKYALPLIFASLGGNKLKTLCITTTTLPPAGPLSQLLGKICDSVSKDVDIYVRIEVTVNNKLSLLLSTLHGLSSLELDIREEHVPDLSNLPTWTSPENILSMRRRLGVDIWSLVEERCPKMKLPDNLGDIIEGWYCTTMFHFTILFLLVVANGLLLFK